MTKLSSVGQPPRESERSDYEGSHYRTLSIPW
jgi:hypothetical protein